MQISLTQKLRSIGLVTLLVGFLLLLLTQCLPTPQAGSWLQQVDLNHVLVAKRLLVTRTTYDVLMLISVLLGLVVILVGIALTAFPGRFVCQYYFYKSLNDHV